MYISFIDWYLSGSQLSAVLFYINNIKTLEICSTACAELMMESVTCKPFLNVQTIRMAGMANKKARTGFSGARKS